MRVLVVEDDRDIATLISAAFRREGSIHVSSLRIEEAVDPMG